MNTAIHAARPSAGFAAFELRFQFLFKEGRALAFPCDDHGQVDIDQLPAGARHNYLCARTLIGREFAMPRLQAVAPH